MREIKFRVWDNVNNYMSGPFTLQDLQDRKIQFTPDCIVMQYTGLKDKHGVKIFEGDKLRGFRKEQSDKEGVHGYWVNDTVICQAGSFKVFSKHLADGYTRDNNCLYQFMWVEKFGFGREKHYQIDEIEIIGNIHEPITSNQ